MHFPHQQFLRDVFVDRFLKVKDSTDLTIKYAYNNFSSIIYQYHNAKKGTDNQE